MFERDNNVKTFVGISVTAAMLTGLLVVSCAPVPQSFPKSEDGQLQSLSSRNHQNSSAQIAAESAALDGDWVCDSSASCAYSDISISTKDGIAVLNGSTEQSAKMIVGTNSETSVIQLSMTLVGDTADTAKIFGTISLKGSQDELVIGSDSYSRKNQKQ